MILDARVFAKYQNAAGETRLQPISAARLVNLPKCIANAMLSGCCSFAFILVALQRFNLLAHCRQIEPQAGLGRKVAALKHQRNCVSRA